MEKENFMDILKLFTVVLIIVGMSGCLSFGGGSDTPGPQGPPGPAGTSEKIIVVPEKTDEKKVIVVPAK